MKRLLILLVALCAAQLIYAQATAGINYQAVLRDGNAILTNATVDVLLAIEDANANILYEESHTGLTTDQFGVLNFVIGSGAPVVGSFESVDWSQAGLQYESEVTYNGTIFSLGRIELQSVPYALYADGAGFADSAAVAGSVINLPATALNDLTDVSAAPDEIGQVLIWDSTEWVVNQGVLILDGEVATLGLNGSVNTVLTTLNGAPDGGAVALFEENGFVNLIAAAGIPGLIPYGILEIYGENGSVNLTNVDLANSSNTGFFGIGDSAGEIKLQLDIPPSNAGGEGRMIAYGANGNTNFILGGVGADPELGAVSVWDSAGNGTGIIGAGIPGLPSAGFIELYGSNGAVNLTTVSTNTNVGYLGVADSMGEERIIISPRSAGDGLVRILGQNGNNAVTAGGGIDGSSGSIALNDSTGFPRINMGVTGGNRAFLELIGPSATAEAGMQIMSNGDGVVFADVKNFRMEHPNQPGKEIWYASLEGPEAGAYVRGTGQLVNGEAVVTFPEHFQAVANAQTMTVVLTPLSADSEGMAVIEKTETGFRVKELRQGAGTYGFDWEVKCVRAGYEDYEAVRDAQQMPRASMERSAPVAKPHAELLPQVQERKATSPLKKMLPQAGAEQR